MEIIVPPYISLAASLDFLTSFSCAVSFCIWSFNFFCFMVLTGSQIFSSFNFSFCFGEILPAFCRSVSYTHLDVYKRQFPYAWTVTVSSLCLVYPFVFTFDTLLAIISRAFCCTISPRLVVSNPINVGLNRTKMCIRDSPLPEHWPSLFCLRRLSGWKGRWSLPL